MLRLDAGDMTMRGWSGDALFLVEVRVATRSPPWANAGAEVGAGANRYNWWVWGGPC